jgi:hypothetical protein
MPVRYLGDDMSRAIIWSLGMEVMVVLLEKISPLKRDLVDYISELRDLMTLQQFLINTGKDIFIVKGINMNP